jgi:hypothetical protein
MKSKLMLTIITAGVLLTGCTAEAEEVTIPQETAASSIETTEDTMQPITVQEIRDVQTAWGEGLVSISTAYRDGSDYGSAAQAVLDNLYGYVDGVVLFKPTLASEVPFRFTEAEAASYFIGGGYIAEDTGFALKPWTEVRFSEDGEFILQGESALWMGSVFLTDEYGDITRVEKSMGYYRDNNGDVRINLHHSSVPFEA